MNNSTISRRTFLKVGVGTAAALAPLPLVNAGRSLMADRPVVAIARVRNDNVAYAVEEAIDLLGGISAVTRGKTRILLKPNLVAASPDFTTKPEVIRTLARLMTAAGKDVSIGEGSAAAEGFNVLGGETCHTKNRDILDRMQQYVFDQLGYGDLAKAARVPLVNLHSGEMVTVPVPDGRAYRKLTLHRALTDADMVCSVPMMKTHVLATVTLGMKNLIGLYPGTVYASVRSLVHEHAARAGSPGVAYEIVDMVRANKLGLVVVDGSMAMEGDGPTAGQIVKMGVIVAGTNPLATDMIAARIMGFASHEVPAFRVAQDAGMTPGHLDEIEVRGKTIEAVQRTFAKPHVIPWENIAHVWGVKELQ
jgi:uncharacterized protein (DUF362 family)